MINSNVVQFLTASLELDKIRDYPNALNGLQLENSGVISKIGAAVDACEATLILASESKIDFLIVHHGLFWQGLQSIQGSLFRKLRLAFESDMAIYSAHLPMDAHPIFGNNVILAEKLGFDDSRPAFEEKGTLIGRIVETRVSRDDLCAKLKRAVGGPIKLVSGGPATCKRVGIMTGGAGTRIIQAVALEGVDTFITGEGAHWTYTAAEELGVNLIYAGHYATETFGVKAIAEHLSVKYQLPWQFIDHPTGL